MIESNVALPRQRRPLPITILCVVAMIFAALGILIAPRMYAQMRESPDAWYFPIWLTSLAATVVSFVGYWRMRRWGVYLYGAATILYTAIGFYFDMPMTVSDIVVPLLITGLGIVYLKRMS